MTSTAEKFQQELKSIAVEFIGNKDAYGIYIGGQTGCGKTHICTAIAGQYIKQGKSVRYMTWHDDSVVLKSYANSPEYHDIISDFKQSDVLYIDDLFRQDEVKDAYKKLAEHYGGSHIYICKPDTVLRSTRNKEIYVKR